jgi:uncharacterized membrane-anchored protein
MAFGRWSKGIVTAIAVAWLGLASCFAQQVPGAAPDPKVEMRAAIEAALAARIAGAADVKLGAQGQMRLPQRYTFIPAAEAGRVLRAMGNQSGESLQGLVMGERPFDEDWFVVVRYIDSGYIKDEEAKDWDASAMLDNLKSGTEESNPDRRSRGIPEIEVTGWIEPPRYDAAAHRLVWSAGVKDKGATGQDGFSVNYNTYVLGREGYLSMNLVTTLALVESQKPMARELLAAMAFNDGKRYGDFNASTDRVAEFGLAALVGGIAAKKLGLFALAAAFAVKFWKLLAIGGVAAATGAFKVFRRRKTMT